MKRDALEEWWNDRSNPWPIQVLDQQYIDKWHPELLKTAQHYLPNLDDEQYRIVVSLVLDTCYSCHKAPGSCQCWNDD